MSIGVLLWAGVMYAALFSAAYKISYWVICAVLDQKKKD